MPITLAPAYAEVKPAPSITARPLIDFHPERDILDTEAASFAAWMAEEDADDDQWSDEYPDEMADRGGVFLPESARPAVEALAQLARRHAGRSPVIVGIAGFSYRVEPLAIAPAVGTVAYSLADLDRNRLHHVHRSADGEVRCDCADFTFRRCGSGQPCKHGRRLVELGLIPATTPTVLPPFAARG